MVPPAERAFPPQQREMLKERWLLGAIKGVVTAGVGEASGAAGAPQAEQRSASMHSAKKQYSFFSQMAIDLSSM